MVAVIITSETHSRTWARTLSYRFMALLITAWWTGIGSAVLIHVILALLHYVMERLWLRVSWGMKSQ